ncbi:HNH endonuclease [Ruminococcus callidus]
MYGKDSQNELIHFEKSLCDGMQNIRFTSDNMNAVFARNKYEDGYVLCYELCNTSENTLLTVKIYTEYVGRRQEKLLEKLLSAAGADERNGKEIVLKRWNISEETENISQITEVLNQLFDYELSYFETELKMWLDDHDRKIKTFPLFYQEEISNSDLPEKMLIEGAMRDILTNKYERSRKARARCIAHYGTACQVCGIDFGAMYGEEFAGKINVHHRKPLYEIKEDYVVDPVKDFVPVCPNCHMVLHSKKDGVYTVEEVRAMLDRG